MKVIINTCFGGFSLSQEAVDRCVELSLDRDDLEYCMTRDIRTNPIVIQVVEELGEKANGDYAKLKIIDIPFDSEEGWHIEDYDGRERVSEEHRTWN
jgi:hypothetical protein